MTVAKAVQWFVTQQWATLNNLRSRTYLLELLNDPVVAESKLRYRQELRIANVMEVQLIEAITTDYTEILARLPINWNSRLERNYLSQIVATATPLYETVINNLLPLLWYKMDEVATPAVNHGSVASVDGTVANMGAFQAAGPNTTIMYSYDFNGTTSIITVPTAAGLASADFTLACLINADTIGEASSGCFFEGLNTAAEVVVQWFFINAGTRIRAFVFNTAGGNSNFQSGDGVDLSTWQWLFMTFSATTALASLYKSVSGSLTEFTYNPARTALTGTPRQITQGRVGNNPPASRTFDGKYAQFIQFGRILTTVEMQSIITASGVI